MNEFTPEQKQIADQLIFKMQSHWNMEKYELLDELIKRTLKVS